VPTAAGGGGPADGRVVIVLGEGTLFRSGETAFAPAGATLLGRVGAALREITDAAFRVEAHTDATPPRNPPYASNWDLSAAQATAVVRALEQLGHVEPSRLTAVARGADPPSVPPAAAPVRRIEIVLEARPVATARAGAHP
jgi:chemotaxis protein MotB